MFYTYESGGRVSRPISDYRSEVLSGSFAARGLESFNFNQGPAVPLSDIGGTLAQYADLSIYNLASQRSGLGVLSGAQTSQQDVPEGYVLHQAGPVYTWTTDELGGNHDHNRILRPAPSRLLFFNNAEETKTYSYHPAILDLYTEVDFGSITQNATSTSNNGLVADLNATQVEYGRIIHVGNLESFGFNKTLNEASWKATSAWVGEGRLISFGNQSSPAIYGAITDGKVRLSGTADVDYSPAIDGRGILPLQGDSVIGFAAGITGSGTLKKFTGTSESITVNPDEKQMLFSFLGVVIEKDVNVYNGSGSIKNLSTVEIDKSYAWNGSGTITIESDKPDHYQLKDIAHWVLEDIKSRPLASIKYELSDEKHTEDYNESAIDRFTERDYGLIIDPSLLNCVPASGTINTNTVASSGCIKVDTELALNATYSIPPAITTPSTSIDWGDITTIASLQQDWGELLVTSDLMPFGGIKVDPNVGAADKFLPSWTSKGYIGRLFGEARVPLDVGVRGAGGFRFLGASKTNFSLLQPADGLFRVVSDSQIGFSAGITGTGTLRKFAGSAQSLTVNPEETQLLFSFVGERNAETTSTVEIGQGNLFNFSNFVERTTFDYVGQGTITLESRKPDQLTLEELAKRTLTELRNVNLGDLRYELSDEKHTENYNSSAFVPSIDLDYGLLVNPATYACVDTNGNITVSTVAATGCTKVAPGQTLSLANGVTYTVPQQIATPTTTIDYGLVSEIHSPTDDYGWILGTHAHGIPYGMFDVIGTAGTPRVFNEVSEGGLFKITGDALLPLFASVLGDVLFKPYGESITNFSLLAFGGGEIPGMYGDASYSFQVEHVGDGSLRKLGGSAYSTTYNPEERQLLFSFTGERIAESKSIREIGSGRIKNLATRESEKNTYDYVGSGSILTWNKLEEARAVAYNCSSIVPFPDLDYGFIVDPSTYVCVDASGNITTSQVAASGCIKATPGQTLSIAPGVTYTVPSQTTVPTDSESYGSISDPADEPRDYEWILGTVAMGQPSCIYGEIDITGVAETPRVFNEIGDGRLFKLRGVARVPLDAKTFGTGLFKPQGASITNFSLLAIGGGHINGMYGDASYNFQVEHRGEGRFSTFSGGAQSLTINPEEKQLLFSFTGGYTDLSFTHGTWHGSGRIKNLATLEAEKSTYDYVGSGSILTWNKLEEARTYWYNCSSIVEFQDLDYGFIVDPTTYACVDASGNVTLSTVAASGCTKVAPGQTLSIAPGITYTVPQQITTPTEFIDYKLVKDNEDQLLDLGHILDTVAMGQPACIYGTLEVRGTATSTFQPNWNGRGTVKVGNAANTNLVPIVIGSGTLFTFSGSSETLSAAVAGGGLFNIGGDPGIAFSPGILGEGRFSTFSGAAESLTFNPEEKQMLFSFIGTSGDPGITLAHEGEGVLFAIAGSGEREANAYYGSGTLKLRTRIPEPTEPANEKHTEVYDLNACIDPEELDYGLLIDPTTYVCVDSSGNITASTTAASGCIKAAPGNTISVAPGVTYTVPSFITTVTDSHEYGFIFDPPDLVLDYGWILDDTGKECPFGPIGVIRGTSGDPIRTFREVFTGESAHWAGHGITITGDAEIVVPPQWDSPAEPPVKVYGAGKPNFSLRTFGGGNLWSMGGSSEAVRYSPQEEQVLFKFVPGPFSRWTTYDWQPSWVTRGFIRGAIGEAKTHWVPNIIGSGTLRKFNGVAESLTVNPEERQLLFSFTGEHQVSFTANPPERTPRIVVSGDAWPTRYVPHWTGSGTIPVTGIAKTHYVPDVVGVGTLRKFAGAAESLTFNPEEKQMLFSFIGERLSEKKSVAEIGSGNILVTGLSKQVLTFAEQPFGRISVSGIGHTTRTRPYIGSGFLRKLGGSAESITVNPDERQMLFSFMGEGTENTTISTVGSGTLFGFSGASVVTAAAYESQGLFRIDGDSIITASLLHVGSGTFRKFNGAAESLTFNPDERQMLFSFTGESIERVGVAETKQIEVDIDGSGSFLRAFAHEGSGTFRLSNTAGIRWVPNNIGSGTIFTLEGAAESLTFNPEEKQMLFSFTGEHQVSFTANPPDITTDIRYSGTSGDPLLTFAEQGEGTIPLSGEAYILISLQHFGSGSLYTINGAAESATFNPEERQLLFSVLGESTNKISVSHIGSGSLRKLGGSAEAVAFNPEERQLLFSFNGAGSQSTTTREIGTGSLSTTGEAGVLVRFAHTGEGTIPLSGTATVTRTRDFVGFGFIPVLTGAAESLTFNPTERDMLFSFTGERISEKTTARELSQGGTLVVGSTSGDPLLTFAEQPQIEVAISGDSYDLRAFAYQGSGRLSNVNNLDEAFALAPYNGSGTVSILGNAFVQVQLFQPPHAQVWII